MHHHKSQSYHPPPSPSQRNYFDYRNSTPALFLNMEMENLNEDDSFTEELPRERHSTWSHSQHLRFNRSLRCKRFFFVSNIFKRF